MSKKFRYLLSAITVLCSSMILTFILLLYMHSKSMAVVHQWKQPSSLSYGSFDPYYLSVVEYGTNWDGFPLHTEPKYIIYVGRDSGSPSYGHMINYSFHPHPDDMVTFLKKAESVWTADGVELQLPSGHRVFIPKKMFIGGR